MSVIFKNYEIFFNMILSVTILANSKSAELVSDGKKIIEFIGQSYGLDNTVIESFSDIILNKLSALALTSDLQAIYRMREASPSFSEEDILFDMKADAINTLQTIKSNVDCVSPYAFIYNYYQLYQENVRFEKINAISASGNKICTRQVGIMKALGIGCSKDLTEAIKRLTQCALWADIPSMFLLSYCYRLNNDPTKAKLFREIGELCKQYLYSGGTLLPDEAKSKYSPEACTYYVYISSIFQDIVLAYNRHNIDFSFVEAITCDSLSHFQRMKYIDNYEKKEWKDITNSSEQTQRAFGFH